MGSGRGSGLRSAAALAVVLAVVGSAQATWSIVIADSETKEVAVGTVTCLNNYDLLAIVPVVVVGKGGAACQASGDFNGIRRPVIWEHLILGTPPEEILEILAEITGHQSRQYGIADTLGRMVTFTGGSCGQWAGGMVGTDGSLVYAIQGNVLAGECVVTAIEEAILSGEGDVPEKLMAGMWAAFVNGGDGRCSCSPYQPTSCGCPPEEFEKSGHIGGMVVARIGDIDDPLCDAGGCADGDYFMRLNVAFQNSNQPDPVIQLLWQFEQWRVELIGRPDAIQSAVELDPETIPPNGTATTTMHITLFDWQGQPIYVEIQDVVVEHGPESDGLSSIGEVIDNGDGTFSVEITAGTSPGSDRFRVTVDDGIRPVVLMPDATLRYFPLGDLNQDGCVDQADLGLLLADWDCTGGNCPGDADGDGDTDHSDLGLLLGHWGEGCP